MPTVHPGSLVHLELHTPNLPDACDFYRRLCRWPQQELRTSAGTYRAFELGSIGGGVVQTDLERPLWLPYVAVEDAAYAVERALSLGARLLLEPREGPTGWRAVVAAAAGGEIAFWQPKQ